MTMMTQNGSERTTSQPVLLGSLLPQASTMGSSPQRTCVPLCMSPEPNVRHEPKKHRTREEVPKRILRILRDMVRGQQPWPLFMWGHCGPGKTCAALMLLDYCNGLTHYWTVQGLCEHLIECDNGRVDTGGVHPITVTRTEYWKELRQSQVVVLDELGTRRKEISDHHLETVKRVLDIREGSPLIVISNLRAGDLAELYGDRIPSRCAAGTIVDWSAYHDRRIAHHAKEKP